MPTKTQILRACDTLAKRYAKGGVEHTCEVCPLCKIYLDNPKVSSETGHRCGNCPNQAFNSDLTSRLPCLKRNSGFDRLNWYNEQGEANLSKFWFDVKAFLKTKNTKELNNLINNQEIKARIVEIAKSI